MRQSVRLVKTHLMICDLTYLGQAVTLTLDDLSVPNVSDGRRTGLHRSRGGCRIPPKGGRPVMNQFLNATECCILNGVAPSQGWAPALAPNPWIRARDPSWGRTSQPSAAPEPQLPRGREKQFRRPANDSVNGFA